MPSCNSGSSRPVCAIEQADLDDVVVQQVAGEPADVELEQLDAFLDAHLGKLIRRQGGQFPAGLVQGVELLLLLHLGGDVAAQDDEQRLVLPAS